MQLQTLGDGTIAAPTLAEAQAFCYGYIVAHPEVHNGEPVDYRRAPCEALAYTVITGAVEWFRIESEGPFFYITAVQ